MGVRKKKSALIKFLIFFGEMSVMTMNELNELVISYGLKAERQENYIYCMYKDLVVLVYDNSNGKVSVWMGHNFSNYMDLKSDIEVILKNTIIETKKEELEIKQLREETKTKIQKQINKIINITNDF